MFTIPLLFFVFSTSEVCCSNGCENPRTMKENAGLKIHQVNGIEIRKNMTEMVFKSWITCMRALIERLEEINKVLRSNRVAYCSDENCNEIIKEFEKEHVLGDISPSELFNRLNNNHIVNQYGVQVIDVQSSCGLRFNVESKKFFESLKLITSFVNLILVLMTRGALIPKTLSYASFQWITNIETWLENQPEVPVTLNSFYVSAPISNSFNISLYKLINIQWSVYTKIYSKGQSSDFMQMFQTKYNLTNEKLYKAFGFKVEIINNSKMKPFPTLPENNMINKILKAKGENVKMQKRRCFLLNKWS